MDANVVIYSTTVCPFCIRAKRLLTERGLTKYREILIDKSPEQREQMMLLTGRRTVPQIFIGDEHVGGFDDLAALDRRGELLPMLQRVSGSQSSQ